MNFGVPPMGFGESPTSSGEAPIAVGERPTGWESSRTRGSRREVWGDRFSGRMPHARRRLHVQPRARGIHALGAWADVLSVTF